MTQFMRYDKQLAVADACPGAATGLSHSGVYTADLPQARPIALTDKNHKERAQWQSQILKRF